jgi:hypothetical protein
MHAWCCMEAVRLGARSCRCPNAQREPTTQPVLKNKNSSGRCTSTPYVTTSRMSTKPNTYWATGEVCVGIALSRFWLRRTCTMHARISSSQSTFTFQPCGAGYGCTRWRSCCCVRRSREPVPRSRYEHAPHQRLVAALTSSPLISTAFLFLSLQDLVSQHKDSPTTARQSRSWLRIELWRSIAWTCISLPR